MIRFRFLSLMSIAGSLAWFTGCGAPEPLDTITIQVSKLDHLGQSMEMAFSESQFDFGEFESKIEGGLNRWIGGDDEKIRPIEWAESPALAALPNEIKESRSYKNIISKRFLTTDAHFLQSAVWLNSLAMRISQGEPNGGVWPSLTAEIDLEKANAATANEMLVQALAKVHTDLDEQDCEKLSDTLKLFDWTVRHLQMTELKSWPDDATVQNERLFVGDGDWPPNYGVPGPGYQRMTWQILLYGRGDALERYRVFIQMAQRLNIDVCLLGVKTTTGEQYQPLVAAASIGGKLFLFDARLGLPIPGSGKGQIATLSDVKANPELLKSLDLKVEESTTKNSEYWFKAEYLDKLVAIVDAVPEAISYRMNLLEKNLAGDQRLTVALRLDDLIQRLQQHDEIDEVVVWAVPFMAEQYRDSIEEGMVKSRFNDDIKQKLSWHPAEQGYIDNFPRLRTARVRYLMGIFDVVRNNPTDSAVQSFLKLNYSDNFIAALDTDERVQNGLGLDVRQQGVLEFEAQKEIVRGQLKLIRVDAVYFLVLCENEIGNPANALNWARVAERMDDRLHWSDGTSYNAGRAHESLKQLDEAIKYYQRGANDKTLGPQTHGNLIRARLLNAG